MVGTILLVEDNRDDEALTIRAFKKANITNEIIITRDGQQAIDFLSTVSELPKIILLDLKLPKVDGIEVLNFIRSNEKTKLTPVIILTSSREEKDLIAGYKGGANSYVCKPVDIGKFMEAVGQLGLYWLLVNEKI